jgi:F-type H+-transporting ATPase subunit delta
LKDIIVANRYALALYDSLKSLEEKKNVIGDFEKIRECMDLSIDFASMIKNPLVKKVEKLRAIDQLAKNLGLSEIVTVFLKLLAEKNRLGLLSQIQTSLVGLYNDETGCVDADVVVAYESDDAVKSELSALLQKLTGKRIRMNVKKDARIIGGFVAKVKSNLYDASIKGQLERLSEIMTNI